LPTPAITGLGSFQTLEALVRKIRSRLMSSPPYLALLLVTAVSCTIGGCTSKRETRLTSGAASLVYRQNGDISIRTPTLSIHLSPHQALSASLAENGKELTLASQAQRGGDVPSD
jgi:hypothetical protein